MIILCVCACVCSSRSVSQIGPDRTVCLSVRLSVCLLFVWLFVRSAVCSFVLLFAFLFVRWFVGLFVGWSVCFTVWLLSALTVLSFAELAILFLYTSDSADEEDSVDPGAILCPN